MKLTLLNIPGINREHESELQIRALCFEGKSPVLVSLAQWAESDSANYKKILHSMLVTAQTKRGRPISEKHVKKCAHPSYGDVYEFRANKSSARIMFFYATPDLVVCTNVFEKKNTSDDQDAAFRKCSDIRNLWDKMSSAQSHERRNPKLQ